MPFELRFLPSALKEWEKLGHTLREQFKKKLAERVRNPRIEADKLRASDLKDCYKIKLRSSGYRLVYRVDEAAITMTVVTIGQRDRSAVYVRAKQLQNDRSPAQVTADDPISRRGKRERRRDERPDLSLNRRGKRARAARGAPGLPATASRSGGRRGA